MAARSSLLGPVKPRTQTGGIRIATFRISPLKRASRQLAVADEKPTFRYRSHESTRLSRIETSLELHIGLFSLCMYNLPAIPSDIFGVDRSCWDTHQSLEVILRVKKVVGIEVEESFKDDRRATIKNEKRWRVESRDTRGGCG